MKESWHLGSLCWLSVCVCVPPPSPQQLLISLIFTKRHMNIIQIEQATVLFGIL